MSKFGRYQAPEPLSALLRFHHHSDSIKLAAVDHEPKVAVLDQEDLLEQGIRVSQFIPGATDVNALGSCTANTTVEALSNILPLQQFAGFLYGPNVGTYARAPYSDTKAAEEAAIRFYHGSTDQTADSATEWPPTDCGSSGPYIEKYAQSLRLISTAKIAIAGNADSIVSLMQSDGLLAGMPFLNAWMEPDSAGFVDGNGSASTLQAQMAQGVAGGHEIYFSAIEKLALLRTGHVDASNTVVRFRNHWTKSWGDNGSARFHLSTIVALASYVDLRQFIAA